MRQISTLTLGRLAWRRLRDGWTTYLPTSLGLALALGMVTAVILTQALTSEASLRAELSHLGPDSLVEVHQTRALDQRGYDSFNQEVQRAAREDMGGLITARGHRLRSGSFLPTTRNGARIVNPPTSSPSNLVVALTAREEIRSHASLLAGGWPEAAATGPWPAAASEESAAQLGVKLGDVECVAGLDLDNQPACFRLTGIWRARDLSEPFWGTDPVQPRAFELPVESYFAVLGKQPGQQSDAVVVFVPDLGTIRAGNVEQVLDRLRRLRGLFSVRLPDTTLSTGLDQALESYQKRAEVAAFAVQLVAAQLLLIALYSVGFLATRLLDQQRGQIAIWRARGWSWPGIAGLLVVETTAIALAALPVGLAAGWLGAEAVAHFAYGRDLLSAGLEGSRLWQPVAGTFGLLLALVWSLAAWAARRSAPRQRLGASRPSRPWWRRWHVDLVLALLSLPLLAQSRLLGSSQLRQSGAVTPYDVLLPALAAAFIALAGLRLLPLIAAGVTRLRRGVANRLAAVQLGRAPAQHAGLGLLLTLTVGIGVFAATYGATSSASAADRAAYLAGADVRGVFGGALPTDFDSLHVPGAAVQSPVFRSYGRPGASNDDVPVMAVDPYSFQDVAWRRPDLYPRPLSELLGLLASKETGGLLLPRGARSLSVWIYGAATGGTLYARLSDASGRGVRADFGRLDFDGWRQLKADLAPDPASLREPLRFRELTFTPVARTGTMAVSSLEAAGPGLSAPVVLEAFAGAVDPNVARLGLNAPWWQTDPETSAKLGGLLPSLRIPRDGAPTVTIYLQPGWLPAHMRPSRATTVSAGIIQHIGTLPVPGLTSVRALARLGLKIGDVIQLRVDQVNLAVSLVGTLDYFPTLYSGAGDFFVLAEDPALAGLGEAGHQRAWPDELWVKAQPGQSGTAAAELRSVANVVDVFDRPELQRRAQDAPARVELAANLGLGFAATLLLALLGFGIHFLLLARGRSSDYAVLQANGMAPGQLRRSLGIEQAVLVIFSLLAGCGLGALLALAILPALQLGTDPTDTVPPTLVTFDPRLLALALVAVALGMLVAGRLIGRLGARVDLVKELRSLG